MQIWYLKKHLIFLKNHVDFHFPEEIENEFILYWGLYNSLIDYGRYDDWKNYGSLSNEDINIEYNSLN